MQKIKLGLLPIQEGSVSPGSSISDQFAKNCIYEDVGTSNAYVAKRPAFGVNVQNPFSDQSINGVSSRVFSIFGRNDFYIQYGGKLFANDYTNEILSIGGIPAFRDFYLCGDKNNIFLSQAGNPFTKLIDSANNATNNVELDNILDLNPLCRGCALLNGIVFVQRRSGEIYNSAVEDFSSWNSLDFISSELLNDEAYYIDSINNNIVSFNSSSIEFFEASGSPTGSAIRPRLDVSFQIGGEDDDVYFKHNDRIYFLGREASKEDDSGNAFHGNDLNDLGLYVLENFSIKKLSNHFADEEINKNITASSIALKKRSLTGYFSNGRLFLCISALTAFGGRSLVYDTLNGSFYYMDFLGDYFTSASGKHLISSSGHTSVIRKLKDKDVGLTGEEAFSSVIEFKPIDFGTRGYKRIKNIDIDGDKSVSTGDVILDIKYDGSNFGKQKTYKMLAQSKVKKYRFGRFKSVSFSISFDSAQRLRSLDVEF